MTSLWKKLNLSDHKRLAVLTAPPEFHEHVDALDPKISVTRPPEGAHREAFVLCFVKSKAEIERWAPEIGAHTGADPVLWFAYPKQTSRRYACDITRDTGWKPLIEMGLKPVRQVP